MTMYKHQNMHQNFYLPYYGNLIRKEHEDLKKSDTATNARQLSGH